MLGMAIVLSKRADEGGRKALHRSCRQVVRSSNHDGSNGLRSSDSSLRSNGSNTFHTAAASPVHPSESASTASDVSWNSQQQLLEDDKKKQQKAGLFGRPKKTAPQQVKNGSKSVPSNAGARQQVPATVSAPTTTASPTSKITSNMKVVDWKFEKQKENAIEIMQRLAQTIEKQELREADLETKIQASLNKAKDKLALGSKTAAVRAMKQKKRDEVELEKVSSVINTLITQIDTIDSVLNQVECLGVMKSGAATMEELRSSSSKTGSYNSLKKVEELMDNIRLSEDYAAEIAQLLSEPVQSVLVSDEELLAELAELEDREDKAPPPTRKQNAAVAQQQPERTKPVLKRNDKCDPSSMPLAPQKAPQAPAVRHLVG